MWNSYLLMQMITNDLKEEIVKLKHADQLVSSMAARYTRYTRCGTTTCWCKWSPMTWRKRLSSWSMLISLCLAWLPDTPDRPDVEQLLVDANDHQWPEGRDCSACVNHQPTNHLILEHYSFCCVVMSNSWTCWSITCWNNFHCHISLTLAPQCPTFHF